MKVYPPGSYWVRDDFTTANAGPAVEGGNRATRRALPKIERKAYVKNRQELIAQRWPVKFGRAIARFLGIVDVYASGSVWIDGAHFVFGIDEGAQ